MNLGIPYNAGNLSNIFDFFQKVLNHGVSTVIIIYGRTENKVQNTLYIYPVLWRAFEPITSKIRSVSVLNLTVNFGNTAKHLCAV
jgi:hypothetical protein